MPASRSSVSSLVFHLSLLLALLLTSCAGPKPGAQDLPHLMVERMSWMDEVAQVKQARSLPVTDAKREAELLDAMTLAGTQQGLPAAAVRSFFSGQIDAAKVYQREWLAQHASQSPPSTQALPDLATTVRPALDALGKQMLRALAKARGSSAAPQIISSAQDQLTRAGYSRAVIRPAMAGLEAGLR